MGFRVINKGSKIADGLDLEGVNEMSRPSTLVLVNSQVNGNIETHSNLVLENWIIGDADRFSVSYYEEPAPVIFRNCVINDEATLIIETGNRAYVEINNLELDKGSVFIINPEMSCVIDNVKLGPYSTFHSADYIKSILMKDVTVMKGAAVDLLSKLSPQILYLNNVSFGVDSDYLVENWAGHGNLSLVDVKVEDNESVRV